MACSGFLYNFNSVSGDESGNTYKPIFYACFDNGCVLEDELLVDAKLGNIPGVPGSGSTWNRSDSAPDGSSCPAGFTDLEVYANRYRVRSPNEEECKCIQALCPGGCSERQCFIIEITFEPPDTPNITSTDPVEWCHEISMTTVDDPYQGPKPMQFAGCEEDFSVGCDPCSPLTPSGSNISHACFELNCGDCIIPANSAGGVFQNGFQSFLRNKVAQLCITDYLPSVTFGPSSYCTEQFVNCDTVRYTSLGGCSDWDITVAPGQFLLGGVTYGQASREVFGTTVNYITRQTCGMIRSSGWCIPLNNTGLRECKDCGSGFELKNINDTFTGTTIASQSFLDCSGAKTDKPSVMWYCPPGRPFISEECDSNASPCEGGMNLTATLPPLLAGHPGWSSA